jgi:hypothetical protein
VATESYGDYEFYYPQLDLTVELPYEIDMGRGDPGEPFHDADRAVAIVYGHGAASEENELAIFELAGHRGSHVFGLDLGRYGIEHSPLLVQFVFERRYIEGPKAGMLEVQDQSFFGVVLAQPAVAEVTAGKRMLASGEVTTLSVSRWGALVYDTPGSPPRLERDLPVHTRRFPPGTTPEHVDWTVSREFKDPEAYGTGPELEHTWATEDNFTPLTFRASLSDQPDPPGVRVIGCAISLRLAFLDPEHNPQHFPSQIPVAVIYDDGRRQSATLEAGGRLLLEVDRTRKAFTLAFDHTVPAYLALRDGDPGCSATRDDVQRLVSEGWNVFGLPFGGTFRTMDWTAQGDAELDPQTRRFESLDDPMRFFGTDVSPIELTLDPHWLFARFEYFDRLHGQKHHAGARVPVPNLLLSGARHAPGGDTPDDWDTQAAWPVLQDDMRGSAQALPWIRTRDELGRPLAPLANDFLLCFEAPGIHVEATSPFDRKLVTLDPDDPRLQPGSQRLGLYDLPAVWKSRNQFVRGPGVRASDLTPEHLVAAKSASAPLTFSLDDLVLIDETGSPWLSDRGQQGDYLPLSAESRVTLLAFDPSDGFRLKVHSPRAGKAFYSDTPFDRNVIYDCPPEVRAVLFCGDLYPIANRRTEGDTVRVRDGHILGARAAMLGDPDATRKECVRGLGEISRHDAAAFDLHYLHAGALHHDHETVVSGLLIVTSLILSPDSDRKGHARDLERWIAGGVDRISARWNSTDVRFEPTDNVPLVVRSLTLIEAAAAEDSFDPSAEERRHVVHGTIVSDDHDVTVAPRAVTLRRTDCEAKDRQRGRSRPAPPSPGESLLAGAHTLGHVFGLRDEHLAFVPGWGLPSYAQPDDAMPYQADRITVMGADRSVRLRHSQRLARWLNAGILDAFVDGARVNAVSGAHWLDPSAQDPWEPLHSKEQVALGAGRCDLFLYGLDPQLASELGASAVLVVRTFVQLVFLNGERPWNDRWQREWAAMLHSDVRSQFDGRFVLEASTTKAPLKRIHVVFEPRYRVTPGEAPRAPHLELTVTTDKRALELEAGTLRCGLSSPMDAVARAIFGVTTPRTPETKTLDGVVEWLSDATGTAYEAFEVSE